LKFVAIFILPLFLFAISLDELNNMPTSLAKDFYIWQFLEQDVGEIDAKKAYKQAQNKDRNELLQAYLKRVDDPKLQFIQECKKLDVAALSKQSKECIDEGFSVLKATQASSQDLIRIYNKTQNSSHKRVAQLMSVGDIFENIIDSPQDFYMIFNASGDAYRINYLDKKATPQQIQLLANEKSFSTSILYIVLNPAMKNLQQSLLFDFDSSALDARANFYLAINAIKYHNEDLALLYLERAKEKFYYRFDKDRVTFWQYQITQDESYLRELSESFDLNIFTIFAKSQTKEVGFTYEHLSLGNTQKSSYDYTNPINWHYTLQEIESASKEKLLQLAKKFEYEETIGEYSFILERYYDYKKHFFPTPFLQELQKDYSIEELALLYAIIRQESRFVTASISTSFALGQTQIMPFLVRAIAKEKGDTIALTDMFKPQKSIEYGLHHIAFLKRSLFHPLLIAYGYNGGIGFTQREIIQKGLFNGNSKYEPWLSMELVPYHESRDYGKKVLANYYIYLEILGKPTPFASLIKPLIDGSKIEKWRD